MSTLIHFSKIFIEIHLIKIKKLIQNKYQKLSWGSYEVGTVDIARLNCMKI